MTARRIVYLCCLAGSGVFFFCYQGWVAWMLLAAVLGLPWVSLLLSLPAMLQFRGELEVPAFAAREETVYGALWGLSELPQPLFRGKLLVTDLLTGKTRRYSPRRPLPTGHCGGLELRAKRVGVCDYLGLFCLPVKAVEPRTLIVRPDPVAMASPPDLSRYIARSWRPKFGGGYAENHELRLYRPGDSLNQVHWKLSAKTGELILREPMEPSRELVLLTLDLSGTREEIDRKFGRLLWVSRYLLEHGLRHEIRCLTADGPVSRSVSNAGELTAAVDALLRCPMAEAGSLMDRETGASWQLHIGGNADES